MAPERPVLSALEVTKRFGDITALDGVTLSVFPGQVVALLGHNGAGKSTFSQLAAGVLRPTSGELTWSSGRDGEELRVGYVSQDVAIYPRSTVQGNLEFMCRLTGTDPSAVARIAGALGLDELLDREAGRLSGGEKRRLHTALGLVLEPDLLLLDEPTAGADAETRERILQSVRVAARAGAGVVYTTHYAAEFEELDARVVVLRRGRVVGDGSVEEIVALGGPDGVEVTVEPRLPVGLPDDWARLDGHRVFVPLDRSAPVDAVLAEVQALGATISEFRRVRPSLDRALIRLSSAPEAGVSQ